MKKEACIFKNKKLILSLLLFLLVFLVLGLPFLNWGFLGDDFGAIFHSMVKNWRGLLKFFYEGDACTVYQPSNYVLPEQTFLSVLYRPLIFVFYWLQVVLWGINPSGYFLVLVFLHAINAVLLFNVFLYFANDIWAFWGALFFSFHPSLVSWFGWISAQQYHMSLLCIILSVIFLKMFSEGKNSRYYFLSLFLFLVSLFVRETFVFWPLFLTLCFYLLKKENVFSEKKFKFNFLIGFYLIALFYFILRCYLFPLKFGNQNGAFLSFIFFCVKRGFVNLFHLAYSLSGFSSLFREFCLLRYMLILSFFFLLFYFFCKSKFKETIILCLFGILLFSWPLYLRIYDNRYVYEVLPFFILLILVSMNSDLKEYFKKIILLGLFFVMFNNTFFLFSRLSERQADLHILNSSIHKLVLQNQIYDKLLCFLGLPWQYFYTGVAQAIWMQGINLKLPIYYDDSTWGVLPKIESGDFLEIIPIKNGYRLASKATDSLWFPYGYTNLKMGEKVINKMDKISGNVFDFDFIIDQKYLDQNPVFISWDYKNKKFLILDPPLK